MKAFPKSIQDYHNQAAEISRLQIQLNNLGDSIVNAHCPYKKGQKLHFAKMGMLEMTKRGIIWKIDFKGVDPNAVESKWILHILLTNNQFKQLKSRRMFKIGTPEEPGCQYIIDPNPKPRQPLKTKKKKKVSKK